MTHETNTEPTEEFLDWKADFPLAQLLIVACLQCTSQIIFHKQADKIECPNCGFAAPITITPRQSPSRP